MFQSITKQAKQPTRLYTSSNTVLLMLVLVLSCSIMISQIPLVKAAIASPKKFRNKQPDGSETADLSIKGGPRGNKLVTDIGYTVIQENTTGAYVYAKRDMVSGALVSSGVLAVSTLNETMVLEKLRIANITEKELEPSGQAKENECGTFCAEAEDDDSKLKFIWEGLIINMGGRKKYRKLGSQDSNRHVQSASMAKGIIRNLVILIKFSDHHNRVLPSSQDFEILMNKDGGDVNIAPTGSVRDIYLTSSYGEFELLSSIVGWVELPKSESYYAGGKSGSSKKFNEALQYALNTIDASHLKFSDYDKNGDGVLDSVMFVHSGYAAEWGATDCYQGTYKNRIWSHKFNLNPEWTSMKTGFSVKAYFTTSALYDSCGGEIARIGTIAHELGHVLGLPDLYMGGSGIGSHGLMGNSWGFDGSQMFPPILSPWSKMMLGWVETKEVSKSGRYTLTPSYHNPDIIKISKGFPSGEYLIIENRQAEGFDSKIPKSGLVIYHIDDKASFYKNPGWLGQDGWPQNGNHYRVAVMQPDGLFELEQGINRGDKNDFYSVDQSIGPNSYPNTDSYQNGNIKKTGIKIYDIVEDVDSKNGISFYIGFNEDDKNFKNPTLSTTEPFSQSFAPSSAITGNPSSSITKITTKDPPRSEIGTTFTGEKGSYGCMFDVVTGPLPIIITNLHFHTRLSANDASTIPIKVYTKSGTHDGFTGDSQFNDWKLICSTNVKPAGRYKRTIIPEIDFETVNISAKSSQAFFVNMETDDLRYSQGSKFGKAFASNAYLTILEGTGVSEDFQGTWSPRVFNGYLRYDVIRPVPSSALGITGVKDNHALSTTFRDNNGSFGIMFNVLAISSTVEIESMDIHLKATSVIPIYIYSKKDNYQKSEKDAHAWELICSTKVRSLGRGKATPIPYSEFKTIKIEKGRTQAFYITSKTKDLRYSNGVLQVNDDFIAILGGSGIGTHPFAFGSSAVYFPRVFNGSIRYSTPPGASQKAIRNENDDSQLLTTYAAGNGSHGIMWNIVSKKDIVINSLDIHTKAQNKISAKLYSVAGSFIGKERSIESWIKICDTVIDGNGSFKRTKLPPKCFPPVTVRSGDTLGLYLTLDSLDLRYTNENEKEVGETYVENNDLAITVGSGVGSYPLSSESLIYPQRVFNGILKYSVLPDTVPTVAQLKTTFASGNVGVGIIFSIQAHKKLKIVSIDYNTGLKRMMLVEVWTRKGLFKNSMKSMDGWSQVAATQVIGKGKGIATSINSKDFADVDILQGEIQTFYITLPRSGIIYTNGISENTKFAINDDLSIMEGYGVGNYLLTNKTSVFSPRVFNGILFYQLDKPL